MPDPQPIAQGHPTEVWGALIGSATIIVGLLTTLYKRQNNDIVGQQLQLNNGAERFLEIAKDLVRIADRLSALEKNLEFDNEEFDRLELEIKTIRDRVLTLEVEHKAHHNVSKL